MMSSVWRFIRRHRRKLVIVGAVSAAAVAAWHFLLPRARSLLWPSSGHSQMAAEFLQFARQHQHLEATLRNCDLTSASLLPRLRTRLDALADTDSLLSELRTGKSSGSGGEGSAGGRLAVWQDLKVCVVTKTLAAVYGACLLTELVHVQLGLLGGYLFLSTCQRAASGHPIPPGAGAGAHAEAYGDDMELSEGVKMAYLGCWRQILEADVALLTERLGAIARRVIGPVGLQEAVSLRRLDTLLHEIRLAFERELDATVRVRVSCGDENSELSITDQAVLSRLIRETQELVDCSDFLGVYKACLDSAFSSLLDLLAEQYHRAGNKINCDNYISIYDVRIPFAKVIPLVDKVAGSLFSSDATSQFNRDLFSTDVLKAFSRNIYDTFSGRETKP